MKSKDLLAYVLLFAISILLLFFVIFLWVVNVGWNYLWLLGIVVTLMTIFLGYIFAKYALAPLVEQNQELDRLLKDTLHELNIPVATIQANVSMLQKRCTDEKSQKRLVRIKKATKQLLELYKEVDFLIKKEIKKDIKECFDVSEVVQERVAFFEDLVKNHKLSLQLEPLKIYTSKFGFIKSFDNLLSNAIKYSPKGALIQIIVNDKKFMIQDNGEGIQEEELFKIFDRYYRADAKQKGYGIGLSIVKNFCDEEGIAISIQSQKHKGTTITLDLSKVAQCNISKSS